MSAATLSVITLSLIALAMVAGVLLVLVSLRPRRHCPHRPITAVWPDEDMDLVSDYRDSGVVESDSRVEHGCEDTDIIPVRAVRPYVHWGRG